ncbi:glycosyltransferase family 4 protein [Kaistella antarctica]|uniref:Glycosyl transferase family 1 n=1 Tax=Kaistella antarctica TaxID=266748 RepID=A0A448NT78_9FLAO|nr:glycosyltransferase family 4 protein [Kaistella antarctica]KEY18074.1 glycosyl transferase family 1 [Kaistella antarctica]SEV82540.1 Glycosyltransferase involved in cell wall bisynthesis [Kaistella antarctica]VEI00646.1 putative glycosyl transferase [Kaistella antarctica]
MKVIVSVFNNLYTDQRVEKVCESLSTAGYEIDLIGNSWGGLPQMERPYPFSRIILKTKILRYAYVEFQWKLYQQLLKKADKNCILLANDLDTILPNYLISKKFGIPLVFDSHEIFTEMPALQRRFTQKIWRSLQRWLIPKLTYMMTASESYADWFAKTYEIERPITVQNFPVKIANLQDYFKINSPKIILYQGVINPSRGLDQIISAMKSLENAELWIAGDGPKKEELESLTKTLDLESKVKFLGKLLPKDLREITKNADVGLSIEENNGLSYYYSMPNKVSDYIQARIPVVVSDFPEMRKVIDRFATGEKISDHSQLAEKIEIVLRNGKLFYKVALDKAAAELCWEKEEPKLLRLFKKVTDENF